MIDFSVVNIGFDPSDLIAGSANFYTLFIGFILLILSMKFAPQIVDFLYALFWTGKNSWKYRRHNMGGAFWASEFKARARGDVEQWWHR